MLGGERRIRAWGREEIKGLGAPILRILREKQLIESCSSEVARRAGVVT